MDAELTESQITFLLARHELIDAVLEMTESADFRAVFGEMSLDEALERYAAVLSDSSDPVLRERYLRLQQTPMDNAEMLQKLRAPSLFPAEG